MENKTNKNSFNQISLEKHTNLINEYPFSKSNAKNSLNKKEENPTTFVKKENLNDNNSNFALNLILESTNNQTPNINAINLQNENQIKSYQHKNNEISKDGLKAQTNTLNNNFDSFRMLSLEKYNSDQNEKSSNNIDLAKELKTSENIPLSSYNLNNYLKKTKII